MYDMPIDHHTMSAAIMGGNIECIKLLQSKGLSLGTNPYVYAVICGQIHVLEWLRKRNPCPWQQTELERRARDSGQLAMLQHLRKYL